MRASVFVPIFALAAFAQEQSSAGSAAGSAAGSTPSVDPAPQTTFLKQTNSLGVVTGQPGVVTAIPTQPGVVTAQPPAESIPALGSGVHTIINGVPGTNSTRTQVVSIGTNGSASIITPSPSASGSGASGAKTTGVDSTGPSGTSGTSPQDTNAANVRAAAGGLVGAGFFVAAFL